MNSAANHDPGDEDRRPIFIGPWCENCGDAFDGPERTCPRPSPGEPYKHCGRGGHMFRLTVEPRMRWRLDITERARLAMFIRYVVRRLRGELLSLGVES